MDLAGKTALVTGASGGIGKALVQSLVGVGVNVAMADRDADKLDVARREVGGNTAAVVVDGIEAGSETKLIEGALSAFGRLDFVLANAGAMVVGGYQEIDLERVSQMVALNVDATFRLSFAALRHFKQAGGGHLLLTSSIAGVKAGEKTGAYAGTKAAIEALVEGLRLELAGSNVKVSVIEPGTVATGLFDDMSEEDKARFKSGELLEPEDISEAALFILTRPPRALVARLLITPSSQAI